MSTFIFICTSCIWAQDYIGYPTETSSCLFFVFCFSSLAFSPQFGNRLEPVTVAFDLDPGKDGKSKHFHVVAKLLSENSIFDVSVIEESVFDVSIFDV